MDYKVNFGVIEFDVKLFIKYNVNLKIKKIIDIIREYYIIIRC